MTFKSYVKHQDASFTHLDIKDIFGHYKARPACLNLLHPLDHHTVSPHADYGRFRDFLVEETLSVTLGLKLTLERGQNSLFWLKLSSELFSVTLKRCANYEPYFGQGTKLTVLEKDREAKGPIVKVLQPSEKECKNKRGNAEKTIVCVATRFYPDHVSVSWQVNGEDVSTGVATDNTAQREDKYYTITSRLRVSAKDWYNPNTEFKCTVSFYNGRDTENYSDSISGAKAKEGVLTREKYLKITQTAKLSYGVFIVKSMVYGVFVAFLVWKLQNSSGKRNH
ncbi:hypothetical protein ABVT39_004583 [Epinephelus coioides]